MKHETIKEILTRQLELTNSTILSIPADKKDSPELQAGILFHQLKQQHLQRMLNKLQ